MLELNSISQPHVRALGWTLLGPSLLEPTNPIALPTTNLFDLDIGCRHDAYKRLLQLNENPSHLLAWLEQRPTRRVGHFFEHLLHYWLEFETDAEVIAAQKQLFENGRTIGEIDFLLRLNNQIIHLESTVKFYLQTNQGSRWQDFVGPNTRDNLFKKTQHLAHHQLPLGAHPQIAKQWNLSQAPTSLAFVKGYLFYPHATFSSSPPPKGVAPGHPKGIWARSDDLNFAPFSTIDAWALIPKPNWIAPAKFAATSGTLLQNEALSDRVYSHFSSHDAALMVTGLRYCGSTELKEALRLMIVGPNWPNFAPKRCSGEGSRVKAPQSE